MAKIDTTKIEGYESMTPEEKLQALEGYEYDDHFEEIERMKSAVTKANGEAAEWKRKHKAQMTEEEQRKQEATEATEKLMKELEELRRDKVVSQYKTSFMGLGYDEATAAETAKAMADGDMAKVFATQQKFQENMAKKLRADALKDTPRPGAGAPGTTDYAKLISESQERGDITAVAYYTRLQAMQASQQE